MWKLGYDSFHFVHSIFIASREMAKLDKSRTETMKSVIVMANSFAKMLEVCEQRHLKSLEEKDPFAKSEAGLNELVFDLDEDQTNSFKIKQSTLFICKDYLL